jgi:hypothetical protein
MSFTKHNNYEVPDGGVQNWDASINENFELMEKGQTVRAIAGTTLSIAEGTVVYMNASERLELAISPSGATIASQFLGFTTTDIATEIEGYVLTSGNFKRPNWAFIPGQVFLDASDPGEVTQTEPATPTMVGYAIGTNELVIKPWIDTSFTTVLTDDITPATEGWVNIQPGLTVGELNVQGPLRVDEIVPETSPWVSIQAGLTTGDLHVEGVFSGIDHGELPGILNDDHPQYLGADMLRPAVGLTISGTLWTDEILPEANPYVNISAGLTIQASTFIRTGVEDLQTTLSLEQQDQDEGFIEFTGLAVTGGTSSVDLDTGELGAVYCKAQVKVNGVTKWLRLYDDET